MNTGKVYRYSVDYLRINLPSAIAAIDTENLFDGLSSNSNQKGCSYLGYDIDLVLSGNTAVMITLPGSLGRPVAEMRKKTLPTGYVCYQFIFYSTFFQFPELKDFLETVINRYGDVRVSRIDLALDCDMTPQVLWDTKKTSFQTSRKFNQSQSYMNAFYLGGKYKNKHHFFRVYDKLLDTEKKKKQLLFQQYYSVDDGVVTRIEAQCEVETCKRIGVSVADVLAFIRTPDDAVFSTRLWSMFQSLAFNKAATDFGFLPSVELFPFKRSTVKAAMDKSYTVRTLRSCIKSLHAIGYPVKDVMYQELAALGAYNLSVTELDKESAEEGAEPL